MKTNITRIPALLLALMCLAGCKDNLNYKQFTNDPPVVASFTPAEGPRYTRITVRGENLNRVTAAYIGGQQVSIKTKVTDSELILEADGEQSGAIRLVASLDTFQQETTTEESFTYRYVAPSITLSQIPAGINVGTGTLIMGANMLAVEEVYLVDAAAPGSAGVKATVLRKTNDEVLVMIPFVGFAQAKFYVTYFDGTSIVRSDAADKTTNVAIDHPTVAGYSAARVTENESFEIEGTFLDRVNKVIIGTTEVPIVHQTASLLRIAIPLDAYPDGENMGLSVTLDYFESALQLTALPPMTIFVPEIYLGSDYITGRGRVPYIGFPGGEWYRSFYQFKAGKSFGNSQWGTQVDPIGFDLQMDNKTTTTADNIINKALVSREDYYSVEPWIYLYGNPPAFYGSASKTNLLRNYFMGDKPANNILNEASASKAASGTPVVLFLQMLPYSTDAKAVAARATIDAVVAKVRTGQLAKIDATDFPINTADNTVGGIPLTTNSGSSAMKGNIANDLWTTGVTSGIINYDLPATSKDGVVMAVYYDYENGYNAANPAAGIYKIGFIHATGMAFVTAPGDSDPRGSVAWIKTYWQKHPY